MDIIIRDALTGLLLLHAGDNSSNDSKDGSTNPTNNDSDATPTSNRDDSTPISNDGMDATLPTFNRSDSTPISNDGMDATPTSLAVETKRKKYKKRGGTSFKNNKGSKKSKYTYKATVKPCARAAKLSANVAISALSKDTYTFENDSVVKKLCEEDVRKLIHLFYVNAKGGRTLLQAYLPSNHGRSTNIRAHLTGCK
jgi:hypothetical protein